MRSPGGRRWLMVGTAGWLLAAVVAVAIAYRAVQTVGHEVVGQAPAPLSQAAVDRALAGVPSETPRPSTSARPSQSPTTSPSPSATSARPSPPSATTHPVFPSTRPATGVTRSFRVTGGTVGVRCTGRSAALLYATPANGWSSRVDKRGPEEVEVRFERDHDESRITVHCEDSGPQAEVEQGDG